MNIALPAVVVFLILAPGFTFRARYRRVERTSLDYAPFGAAVIAGIAFAIVLHALWIAVGALLGWRIVLSDLLNLIGTDGAAQSQAIRNIGAHQNAVLAYFVTILLAPMALAPALRKLAESRGWHLPTSRLFPFFGFDAPWYYLLRVGAEQRQADVLVSGVVNFGGTCYVVRGLVVDYVMQQTGELDRLVLEFADRRPLDEDRPPDGSGSSERYYRIEGDFFVLRYSEAITLNVQYIQLRPASGEPEAAPA